MTLLGAVMGSVVVIDNTRKMSNHPTSNPRTPPHPGNATRMEDDRAATNLGPEVEEGIQEEPVQVPKQPKRRFVGRKAAETKGEQQADPNANIEDSSAIQGVRNLYSKSPQSTANVFDSRPASPYCSCAERDTRCHPPRPRNQRCDRTPTAKL